MKKYSLVIIATFVLLFGYYASFWIIKFKQGAQATVAVVTSIENNEGWRGPKVLHYEFEAGGNKIQGSSINTWVDYSSGVLVFYKIDESGQVHHILQSNWGDWIYFKLSVALACCLIGFQIVSYFANRHSEDVKLSNPK